jgi:hypothetical protein
MATITVPKAKATLEKFGSLARTDTTAKELFYIPKDAYITGIYVIGSAASDAATSAVVSIGTSASANEIMASYDVKTAATGEGYNIAGAAAVGTYMNTKTTGDVLVKGIYAETGTASATGGPWTIKVEYVVTGAQETLVS